MKQSVVRIFLVLLAVPMAAIAETSRDSIQSSIDTKTIEYFWSQPEGKGPFPLLLLVHPDQDSPKSGGRSFVDSGQLDYWSKKGFLTVAISQPGYGGSGGPADFCGPRTQQATLDLLKFFRSKTELVSTHTFIYGGSRGAAVASSTARVQRPLRWRQLSPHQLQAGLQPAGSVAGSVTAPCRCLPASQHCCRCPRGRWPATSGSAACPFAAAGRGCSWQLHGQVQKRDGSRQQPAVKQWAGKHIAAWQLPPWL